MAATVTPVTKKSAPRQNGLVFWMGRVLEECELASESFAPDPVHDLRVALRRCRSMADGLMAMDPDRSWKEMKKAGKRLFSSLGELRDVHVMEEWVGKLSDNQDPVGNALLQYLAGRAAYLKQLAAEALGQFDRKQWRKWSSSLGRRSARFRTGSDLFRHLALEKWTGAHDLHRRVLRSPSQAGWHRLRIGIKRFRYIVENFLPELHELWSGDLKELQDLLGEVHDLDVLWTTALQVNAFQDPDARARWHRKILEERGRRIHAYRAKMVGKESLWPAWRSELPEGKQVRTLAMRRVRLWGSLLDPNPSHSSHVARMALQLYDGLPGKSDLSGPGDRAILQLAAWLHDVGMSKGKKGHHKVSHRLISTVVPPLGCSAAELKMAAVVARYHRGALPRAGQKALTGLTPNQRTTAVRLAGILRLANAFDTEHRQQIVSVGVTEASGFLLVMAQGYNPRSSTAETVAAARHLLETVYRCPILVKGVRAQRRTPAR
jgi:CHAD domain-containing protein